MSHDERIKSLNSFNVQAVSSATKKPLNGSTTRAIERKITFDPKVNYENYLLQFREEFKRKWNNVSKALPTGLRGFTEIGTLGTGSFGNVKLVKRNLTGDLYAAKVLSKKELSRRNFNTILNEKRVLHSIRFPYHTNLEFSRKDENFLYLGMTLAGGGELFMYHRKLGYFNENQARFYAAQIFLALEYLHFMHLIYRDLKPENICLDRNGYVKITDYGFTKFVPNHTFTLCGTPEYIAPEMIKMRPYGSSVDWWAFGVLLYEFVAGRSPFSDYAREPMKMYEQICKAEYKMLKRFSPVFKNLINRLLQPNLSKRIGVCNNGNGDIKRHNWFKKIDWFAILNQEITPSYIPLQQNCFDDKGNEETSCVRKFENNQNSASFERF